MVSSTTLTAVDRRSRSTAPVCWLPIALRLPWYSLAGPRDPGVEATQSQPVPPFIDDKGLVRVVIRLSENRARHHAPGAQSHSDRFVQRRQEVRQPRFPHPPAEIQDIAALHQHGISFFDSGDPIRYFVAGRSREFRHANDFQPNSHIGLAVDPLINR